MFCCLTVAFADDEEQESNSEQESPAPVVVVSNDGDAVAPVVVYNLDDMDAPSSGSLPAAVLSVFGSYRPRTQSVTTYLPDGSTVESTEIVHGLCYIFYIKSIYYLYNCQVKKRKREGVNPHT